MSHLLELPFYLVLIIGMLIVAVPSVIATGLFRKYILIRYRRAHNEIVGYILAVLGGFYGLILGFVVLLVWESYNVAQSNAEKEGSLARGLYRTIRFYPDPQKVQSLKVAYQRYLHNVVDSEYPEMRRLKEMTEKDRSLINTVFFTLERMNIKDDPVAAQMFRQLTELETYRSLRQLDGTSEIRPELWAPLVAGAGILIFFAILVEVKSTRIHLLINGLLGAFIGLVFYIIVMMDHPFTGSIGIRPDAYLNILKMEQEEILDHNLILSYGQ